MFETCCRSVHPVKEGVHGFQGRQCGPDALADRSDHYDVTISYSPLDEKLASRLEKSMIESGISTKKLDGKSEYILHCKVLILVISEEGVDDDRIKDELALAYISNKSIIPVARSYYGPLSSVMPSGMKLMLAKINWTFFIKDEHYEREIVPLKEVIISTIDEMQSQQITLIDDGSSENMKMPDIRLHLQQQRNDLIVDFPISEDKLKYDFWSRHFESKTSTTWIEFREHFLSDYGDKIEEIYGKEKLKMFVNLLYMDILHLNHTVEKEVIDNFTETDDNRHVAYAHKFFDRLQTYVVGILAMKEVLEMDSTLRLIAIQNMASFYSPAVTSMLMALAKDVTDPNTRAVAALALVKSKQSRGKKQNEIIGKLLIKMLADDDRLVRESACLCLANLKYMPAIDGIIHLWRNDAIMHVREAAQLALTRMGGKKSDAALKMTYVLSDEINRLKEIEMS